MRLTNEELEFVDRSVDISIIDGENKAVEWCYKYIPCMSTRVIESLRFKGFGATKVYVDLQLIRDYLRNEA